LRIDTKSGRERLTPRREPYWRKVAQGCYLGFRKTGEGGYWIARFRDEEGAQRYKSLGELSDTLDFNQASAFAAGWFKDRDQGITGRSSDGDEPTVESACRAYVEDRRREKGDACAYSADNRFCRTVYGDAKKHKPHKIAAMRLEKLRATAVKEWRDWLIEIGLSKATVNRDLTTLKAALNLAVRDRVISADRRREWADVKAFKDVSRRRELFLDLGQRRALLNASQGAVRDLIEAAALTGCRAGELTRAVRSAFDARTQTLTIAGKTGSRTMPLSPAAVALFKRITKDKLPASPLIARDDGRAWWHSGWDELVKDAGTKARLPAGVCLYTLRHSFITQCLVDGMATLEVARMVGTSLTMIEKHYGHLVETTARERLAKVKMI
jgi:integrase